MGNPRITRPKTPFKSDPTRVTIQTYDQIAAQFAERHWHVHLERALDAFTQALQPGATVADIGCGPGRDVALLRRRGLHVVGVDLSQGMLQEAQKRVGGDLVQADMRALPFPASSVDGVWLCAALLHIPLQQVDATLREIRRVMRAGPLYVSVQQAQTSLQAGWRGDKYPRYFTFFQPDQLRSFLEGAGFSVSTLWLSPQAHVTWINALASPFPAEPF